ncbi:Aldehyde dehydrogenase N-terminal [Penicillium hordei]|uniref:aldehyde dehydrogenase (NAD(+)) n=1 Tax=Penicillium hordei TaxID=40994 RepID=A0AAD6E057_9EURO|nr:Aldehyde dehydrogenase N-terminal [Penicillium hordei]KAJ5597586.1 Aldehyde dehydrogenase N-terminal [Penicillium hordei]
MSSITEVTEHTAKVDLFHNYQNSINGNLVSTELTRYAINPAIGEPNELVPISTPQDVNTAMDAAQAAFTSWRKSSYEFRKACLCKFIALLTKEQGKPLKFATVEYEKAIECMQAFADLELKEEVVQEDDETRIVCRYTPLGVSVGIVPWNFPLLLACIKLAPATLAGNTIIIKPSPFTPYCGLKLAELAQECFPPGVVQALSGDDNLGPWLTAHPIPEKISFTGSTATGKKILQVAAATMKRVTLECGGNDPAIICSDVDIDETAERVAHFCFLNSGQICLAIKRIYVHESIYEAFRDAMVRFMNTYKIGNGVDEGVFLGPVQNKMQFDRVQGFLDDIEKENWSVATGGKNIDRSSGYFMTPTLIDNPPDDSRIVQEEPFGPIVPLMTWTNEDDVISRANDTRMGLGASVWSRDLDQAGRIARNIEAGSVWVNTHYALQPAVPYGGHKESGIGLEAGMGGLLAFCNPQYLHLKK